MLELFETIVLENHAERRIALVTKEFQRLPIDIDAFSET